MQRDSSLPSGNDRKTVRAQQGSEMKGKVVDGFLHYENTPIQIYRTYISKNWNFQITKKKKKKKQKKKNKKKKKKKQQQTNKKQKNTQKK